MKRHNEDSGNTRLDFLKLISVAFMQRSHNSQEFKIVERGEEKPTLWFGLSKVSEQSGVKWIQSDDYHFRPLIKD